MRGSLEMTNADRLLDSRVRSVERRARPISAPGQEMSHGRGAGISKGRQISQSGPMAKEIPAERNVPSVPVGSNRPYRTISLSKALIRFFSDWTLTGRSSRAEFWWVVFCVYLPLFVLAPLVAGSSLDYLVGVVFLLLLWPLAALLGRRFHDMGVSSGWGVALILFTVGVCVLSIVNPRVEFWALGVSLQVLILLVNFKGGAPGDNEYGARNHG